MTKVRFGIWFLIISTGAIPSSAAPPNVASVDFVVGTFLASEGGTAKIEDFPLQRPFGIDFDSHGNMYVVELEGGRIFKIVPKGEPHVISGDGSKSYRGDGGPIAQATYNGMHNIAINSEDQAFIADSWNNCVRQIDLKSGTIQTCIGTGEAGFSGDGDMALDAQFDFLMCVSLNPSGKALYIADLKNLRIRKVDLETMRVSTVAGNSQNGIPEDGASAVESPLVDPRAVAVDSQDRVYILERGGHALRRVGTDGRIQTVAGTGKKGFSNGAALQSQFDSPKHICVDEHDRVFVADDTNAAIRCYDPATETVSTILGQGFGDKRITLHQPHGVTIEKGVLYVCDTSHNRIVKVVFE